jgi:hypothetical protein
MVVHISKTLPEFANWIPAFAGMTNGGCGGGNRRRRVGGDVAVISFSGRDSGEIASDDSNGAMSAANIFPHNHHTHRSAPSPRRGEGWGEGAATDVEYDARSLLKHDLHLSLPRDLENELPDSLHVPDVASGAHHRPWRHLRHAARHQVQRLDVLHGTKSQRYNDQLELAAEIYSQPNSVRTDVTKAVVQHQSAVVARPAHIWLSLPLSPHPALLRRSTLSRKGRGEGNYHAQTH